MTAAKAIEFDPAVCDLCNSAEYKTILDIPGVSMTSDSRIVASGLRKVECARCGLARNGLPFSSDQLSAHYGEGYELGEQAAQAEPLFFTEAGPVPRSKMVFDWMAENLRAAGLSNPRSVAEVGCGEGSLLSQFAGRWGGEVTGYDMSGRSLRQAGRMGLKVREGSYRDVEGRFDLIYSFAVIEHVPSPSDFLSHLGSRLNPGGLLLTAQPCQDGGGDASYDIFFSDHLHHFFARHVAALGRRAGLRELKRDARHPHITDFSLHVFARDERGGGETFEEEAGGEQEAGGSGRLRRTVGRWEATFRDINEWLESNRGRRLAVWGVGQAFTFFSAYTNLREHPIAVAFDDNPARFAGRGLPFPVMRFDERRTADDEGSAVLFTFPPRRELLRRLEERAIPCYCPLTREVKHVKEV